MSTHFYRSGARDGEHCRETAKLEREQKLWGNDQLCSLFARVWQLPIKGLAALDGKIARRGRTAPCKLVAAS